MQTMAAVRLACSFARKLHHGAKYFTAASLRPCVSKRYLQFPRLRYGEYSCHRRIQTSITLSSEIVSFKLSDIGEGISEVVVKEWYVREGDKVSQFDNICEVQSDKASVTITSRYDGYIQKIYYEVDETAKVGQALVDIELSEEHSTPSQQVDELPDLFIDDDVQPEKVLAIPSVRRLAMENKLNLNEIQGTGKDGRVLKEDVYAFLNAQKKLKHEAISKPTESVSNVSMKPTKLSEKPVELPTKKKIEPLTKDKKVPIKGYKKAMVKSMNKSLAVPGFLMCDEVDVTELVSMRKILKENAAKHDIKFTYLPLFIKATSLALMHYPILNASVDEKCENITLKASHNIGIAMDTPDGLIVPNVKNVQNLTLLEIASELNRIQILGSNGQLGTSDLSNGTFTLSNIGAIGGTYAKPVVVVPEVAIGALGKIQAIPRFDQHDNVVKKHIMQVSWTADHRVIDGATVAQFSNLWKSFIENSVIMLMHMK